ncbi:MAG: hypothetical protein JXR95_03305 [Deltaproteobacteria bacterium]|nr:hypothetical protein [Deltaproteobacteria bacterium]
MMTTASWAVVLLSGQILLGCTQQEGSSCFVNKDCEDGLVCCIQDLNADKGTCQLKENCTGDVVDTVPDSSTNEDGSTDSK